MAAASGGPGYLANSLVVTVLPPTIGPPLSTKVHLGLAILFTSLYGCLFFLIIWQLLAILYYKHRKLSYQSVFLFACLLWAALRTTLFSFYFMNCELSNSLSAFCSWLLFAFPICLQYLMLTILVFYFVLVVVKITSPSKPKKYRKRIFFTFLTSNIIFLAMNAFSSAVYSNNPQASYQQAITIIRVSLEYSFFLAAALVLCFCIIKLTRINSARVFLEGQGVSFCQAITICSIIALLFISRAVYNILAVSPTDMPTFNFGWINVSDQGEIGSNGKIEHNTESYAFMSFGLVLFIWELVPTFITVWFFRVRSPLGGITSCSAKSDSFHTRSYFFDNPNRYDSDDDLSLPYTPPRHIGGGYLDIPNLINTPRSLKSVTETSYKKIPTYGSVPTYGSYSTPKSSYHSPQLIAGGATQAVSSYKPLTEDLVEEQ